MELKDRLKRLREEKGLNKTDTAKGIGVSVSAYSNWEYGNRIPDSKSLEDLSTFFDVSTLYLREGIKTLKDLNEEEMKDLWETTQKKQQKARSDFIKSLSEIDPDSLDFRQEMILRSAVGFSLRYDDVKKNDSPEPLAVIVGILTQLNRMYDIYADESLSLDEKKEGIELYLDNLKTDEVVQNLFDDIADYFISELENNPS